MRIETSIDIAASPERVWRLLADPATYQDWNPLTPRIDGELVVGEEVTLHVRLGDRRLRRVHAVSRVEPGRALCWRIRPSLWMRGERCQTLEPTETGCTYRNEEVIEGVLGPLVSLFYGRVLRASLEGVGEGLKRAVEG